MLNQLILKNKMEKHQFKPFDQVLVRDSYQTDWKTELYSHRTQKDNDIFHTCVGHTWRYCIPYKGNEHLLGTNKDYNNTPCEPKEYHVWTSGTFNEWFTKTEFEKFIKTAVINNKDIKDFHVLYVKHID